jgi:hypothetical protein
MRAYTLLLVSVIGSPGEHMAVRIEQDADGVIQILAPEAEATTKFNAIRSANNVTQRNRVIQRSSKWCNGPALVQMTCEKKDNSRVTGTKRTVSDDGTRMIVEVEQIAPVVKSRNASALLVIGKPPRDIRHRRGKKFGLHPAP